MFVTIILICSSLHDVTNVGLCMLHFTRDYTDILQGILTSLMLFCYKFINVYACQKLFKYSLVWQNYCKNKTLQFFDSQCRYNYSSRPTVNSCKLNSTQKEMQLPVCSGARVRGRMAGYHRSQT